MSDYTTIDGLPKIGKLNGEEQFEIDTSGVSRKTTLADIVKFAEEKIQPLSSKEQTLTEEEKAQVRQNIGAQQSEEGKGLSSNDYTDADKKAVESISGKVDKAGYQQDKIATTEALGKKVDKTDYQQDKETTNQNLSNKVDKISGKGLSSNDYSDSDKQAVASMPFAKGEAENSAVAKNNSNQATATGAMSIGYRCSAETVYSFAGGKNSKTTNKASSSFAFGEGNTAEAYQSVALNKGTRAGGSYSMSVGNGTETNNPAEFACGKHNNSTPDTLFSVGNGKEEEKFNAFEVRKDNTAYVGGVKILNANEVDDAIKKATTGGGGDSGASLLVEVTHSELVALRDSQQLIAGQKYRITDYITMINEAGKFSAEHPFDIIVTALSEDTLSAEASAIAHEGDTFYDNYDLSQWKLHYSLDNDFAQWGLTTPREESYLSDWGSIYHRGTATDESGNSIHIYSANDGGAYWQGKSLTRTVSKTITDYRDIVVKDVGGDELCLYDAYGNPLYKSLYYQQDDEEGNSLYYDDEDYIEGDAIYPVKIVGYGEEDEDGSGEIVVFVTGLDALFENVYNGEISYTETNSYQGDYSDLYISSDAELGTTIRNGGVGFNKLYCSTDNHYYNCSQIKVGAYQHATEQGRGVIYRMVDEFGNDFPYDFYNIGIYDASGYGRFTFGSSYWTNNVDDRHQNNLLQVSEEYVKKNIYLPMISSSTCKNTKIIAETGFSSVKLSFSTDNTIIIAGGSSAGGTATIEIGNANNNRIECSPTSQIKIGNNCVYNMIYVGGTNAQVIAGTDFQMNFINVGSHLEVGNTFNYNTVNAVQLKVDSDYVTRCIFKGNGAIRTESTSGLKKGSMLCFADITLGGAFKDGEVLHLQYDGTTGSTIGLRGLKIHGSSLWRGKYAKTARTVVIPTTHTKDSFEDLTIASNSSGDIKVYSETDLVQ